jgi:hypothetical protein
MRIRPNYMHIANRQFADGEYYSLIVHEERSRDSHNQYFAAVSEGWNNLPEKLAPRFPTSVHLRKWCLIETGYFHERTIICESQKRATLLARYIRTDDNNREEPEHLRIHVGSPYDEIDEETGEIQRVYPVVVRQAKSQKVTSMPKQEFEKSKKAVLDLIESFIGVNPGELKKQAGKIA